MDVFATVPDGEDIEVTEENCEKAFAWEVVSAPHNYFAVQSHTTTNKCELLTSNRNTETSKPSPENSPWRASSVFIWL